MIKLLPKIFLNIKLIYNTLRNAFHSYHHKYIHFGVLSKLIPCGILQNIKFCYAVFENKPQTASSYLRGTNSWHLYIQLCEVIIKRGFPII